MKDFLLKIVSAIVDNPDEVEVVEIDDNGMKIYTLMVPESEIGKIIGKGGKVINSIRCLGRLKAIKTGERALVKVEAKTEA